MEDSEFVFKELGDTAEIMERGGLLPDGPNEEMELRDTLFQDGTCPKLRGFDIRVQEGLETAAEGIRHNVIVHSEELSDLCPEDKIRKEEEFETPPRGGDPRRWTGFQTDGPRDSMIDMGPVPDYVAAQRMVPTDRNRPSNALSPVETLEGTVLEMRRDMENLQTENRFLRTRRIPGPVPLVRQAALTTTKVPGFNGSTSWEQYQQVFDAIALSNGWGDATAALQLLSHLQGDALSVALLLPMPRRSSRKELTHALSSHYGSPGRLASYRRQFDKTERIPGEDPANFGITLETLAVKAFGDIGQTARLRLIRDRFIAGHGSCDLRRHLDCLPPDTPLRDIVDQCRVWESHAELAERNVNQPKGVGKVACKGVSTVDYALLTQHLVKRCVDLYVDVFDQLISDVHNPVNLKLEIEHNGNNISIATNPEDSDHSTCTVKGIMHDITHDLTNFKVNWDQSKSAEFTKKNSALRLFWISSRN